MIDRKTSAYDIGDGVGVDNSVQIDLDYGWNHREHEWSVEVLVDNACLFSSENRGSSICREQFNNAQEFLMADHVPIQNPELVLAAYAVSPPEAKNK